MGYRNKILGDGLPEAPNENQKFFSQSFSSSQTDTVLITPASGSRIVISGVFLSTDATSGEATIEINTTIATRFFISNQSSVASIPLRVVGGIDEVVELTSTQGANELFVLITYFEEAG